MSAIVRPVKKTVKKITKAVSKPIKWIGDTAEDVGEWAVEEVFDPVIEGVEQGIKQIGEDPVKFAAQVAAVSTGNAWALPLIEGADVAAEGGDIGDVLEASARMYVAQQIGGQFVPGAEVTAGEILTTQAAELAAQAAAQLAITRIKEDAFGDDDPPPELMGTEQDVQFYEELPEELKDSVQEVSDSYQSAEAKADEIDQMNSAYKEKAGQYNEYADTLDGKINTQNELKAEVDKLREDMQGITEQGAYKTAVDNYNAKVREYNESVKDAQSYYDENFAEDAPASKLRTELESDLEKIQTASSEYQELKGDLTAKSDALGVNVTEINNQIEDRFVNTLTGNQFNVEEYKQLNKLGDVTDSAARRHFLKEGRLEDLPVNQTQYNQQYTAAADESFKNIVESSGLKTEDLTQAQREFLQEEIASYEGGDLKQVKSITEGSESLESLFKDKIAGDAMFQSDLQGQIGDILSESGVTPNESGVINYGDLSQADKDKVFNIAKDYYSPPEPAPEPAP